MDRKLLLDTISFPAMTRAIREACRAPRPLLGLKWVYEGNHRMWPPYASLCGLVQASHTKGGIILQ